MKVVCVKEGKYNTPDVPKIVVGNFYTVLRECTDEDANFIYRVYVLEEIGEPWAYGRHNFAPVSDIDETEMIRNYQTETV